MCLRAVPFMGGRKRPSCGPRESGRGDAIVREGDLIGQTREQLRSLHFRRDRDWLQS